MAGDIWQQSFWWCEWDFILTCSATHECSSRPRARAVSVHFGTIARFHSYFADTSIM